MTDTASESVDVDCSLRLAIVIGGPIASGKSSLAVGVARAFERLGLSAATIDLDLIYEMLEHTRAPKSDLAVWSRARRTAGSLADALLQDGTNAVVAEGEFLEERAREEFVSMLRAGVPVRFVTLTVGLATALARVEHDPTRGVSRDRSFLTQHYEDLAEALRRRPEDDFCVDTGELTLEETARSVVRWALGTAGADGNRI